MAVLRHLPNELSEALLDPKKSFSAKSISDAPSFLLARWSAVGYERQLLIRSLPTPIPPSQYFKCKLSDDLESRRLSSYV